MDFAQALKERVPACALERNILLKAYTTMRVGGAADYFVEADSVSLITHVLGAAKETGTNVLVMGNGSNLLVKDGGFEGVALHIGSAFSDIALEGDCLVAKAGALLSVIARTAADKGLEGLAFAAGIPGSLGGAVRMNAGAYGGEMAQVVSWVEVLEDGAIKRYNNEQMQFSYRHCRLDETGGVVLRAGFQLKKGDKQAILSQMQDLAARRREKQPLNYASAGSFFKRPTGHFAGALIEGAGLKGTQVGGACVNEKHAGFLINKGQASARDVLDLMALVQQRVYAQYGVQLEPEVMIVGREA